jgi:hypothetical protein
MGSEGDQLVYDYLSQVGDLAQRALPPGERVELVARLRGDIDAQCANRSPAAVRKALARFGSPEQVVQAAGPDHDSDHEPSSDPAHAADSSDDARPSGTADATFDDPVLGTVVDPMGRPGELGDEHLTAEEPAISDADLPDWWRVEQARRRRRLEDSDEEEDAGKRGEPAASDKPGKSDAEKSAKSAKAAKPGKPGAEAAPESSGAAGSTASSGGVAAARMLVTHPREVLAVAVLLAGAVIPYWPLLLAGWALVWFGRRLGPGERVCASVLIPGLVVAAGVGWLWARATGRAGDPIRSKHMLDAVGELIPTLGWAGAIATTFFLLWRISRPRQER